MLLGDLIMRFQDETVVSETLVALGDLALTARLTGQAAESNVSVGELVTEAVSRFVNAAGDEEWLSLIGQMSRAEDPGQDFLRRALSNLAAP
jgi:hypothetical protein